MNNITNLTVKIFPICAILISIYACIFPAVLSAAGFLVIPLLGIIMTGMGATLSAKDFINAISDWRPVLAGIVLQFGLMPLLAFIIGHLLRLPREQFIGLVMVGAVAGGTASNVITYIAGGNVALSITMTACSTLSGIILTPLTSALYLGQTVHVPVWPMFKSILLIVALPVGLGLFINRIFHKYENSIQKICPIVSVSGIVLVIGIIVALNAGNVRQCGFLVFLAVLLHNGAGMLSGYCIARLLKFDRSTVITIAIEVGMQNSGLAAALSKQFFSISSALPGAIFSIWHNISGSIFAALLKKSGKS